MKKLPHVEGKQALQFGTSLQTAQLIKGGSEINSHPNSGGNFRVVHAGNGPAEWAIEAAKRLRGRK